MGLISGRRRAATIGPANCVLIETPRRSMNKLIQSVEAVRARSTRPSSLRAIAEHIAPNVRIDELLEWSTARDPPVQAPATPVQGRRRSRRFAAPDPQRLGDRLAQIGGREIVPILRAGRQLRRRDGAARPTAAHGHGAAAIATETIARRRSVPRSCWPSNSPAISSCARRGQGTRHAPAARRDAADQAGRKPAT
jgi:hypothetical protein